MWLVPLDLGTVKFGFNLSQASNCSYITFTKLSWPGDKEGPFGIESSCHLPTTSDEGHTLSLFIAERQTWKLWTPIFFVVFGLTQAGIDPAFAFSVTRSRPLIRKQALKFICDYHTVAVKIFQKLPLVTRFINVP